MMRRSRRRVCLLCISVVGTLLITYMLKTRLFPGTLVSHSKGPTTCGEQCFEQEKTARLERDDEFEFPEVQSSTVSSDDTSGHFTYLINPRSACSWNSEENGTVKLAIMVVSKVDNFILRYAIRKTWGSFNKTLGTVVFLVGTTKSHDVQRQIKKEAKLYNDVIQVDLVDDYYILTDKSKAMLEWFYRYCRHADIYLKADDDAYVNVEKIYKSTVNLHRKRFLFCSVHKDVQPIRYKKSKWYVSLDEFNGTRYPKYCAGPVYVLSSRLLPDMYTGAMRSKYCRLEDVYITGIATQGLGFSFFHSARFMFERKKTPLDCKLKKYYSVHKVQSQEVLEIHSYVGQHGNKCDVD